jgi:hypothetical protein
MSMQPATTVLSPGADAMHNTSESAKAEVPCKPSNPRRKSQILLIGRDIAVILSPSIDWAA